MTSELFILACVLVLALIQILLPSFWRTRETGVGWNAGPRDTDDVPVGKITGRLQRAQRNLFETLPLFIAAVLIVHVAGLQSEQTLRGAQLYLVARIVYVPLYAFGIPYLRSLAWVASIAGLGLVLAAILLT